MFPDGLLVLGVGAAWTMTQVSSSTNLVALVQTSLMLPVALVSTPAAAIVDMFDRRIVGIVALSIALTGSISLSVLAWLGVMTPALLLASCFIIGSGMALFGPAWQASVSEQVPAEALPSAVALNGISYALPEVSGRRSAASLSRRWVQSLHSPRMRFSICPSSSSCSSGADEGAVTAAAGKNGAGGHFGRSLHSAFAVNSNCPRADPDYRDCWRIGLSAHADCHA